MSILVKAVASKGVFCLYAAANATGYDFENKPPIHPVRLLVRDYIANLQPDLTDLECLLSQYNNNHYYFLRTWVLHHGEPPIFPEINSSWRSKLSGETGNISKLLGDFWLKYKLEVAWEKVLPTYQQSVIKLEKIGQDVVNKIVDYFKTELLGIDKFVIIPNFLESHYFGLGPKIDKTAFAILGPDFDSTASSRVMHEFLHSIINPLTEHLPATKQRSKIREYWIRAIVIRVAVLNEEEHAKKRQQTINKGYKNIDFFLEKLSEFEEGVIDFPEYFKNLSHDLAGMEKC